MNPIMRLLLGSAMGSGFGDRFSKNQTSDLKNLTDALAAYKQNAGPDSDKAPAQSPIDRIKAAFAELKDMHKGPDQTDSNTAVLPPGGASPFDTMHWPYGPVGAPATPMAANAPVPQAPQPSVPMPQPRPMDAPQADANPMMSFFQRNAALQKDPLSGDYIDPASASRAQAQPGILSHLFG